MSIPTENGTLGRCHYYRTVCGLPCHIDKSGRITVTIGGNLQALTTPELLGRAMRDFLSARSLVGPVLWQRSRRYTFLASYSIEAEDYTLYSRTLLRTNSQIVPSQGTVALPSPGDPGTYCRWLHTVRDVFRPTLKTLLDALTECAA